MNSLGLSPFDSLLFLSSHLELVQKPILILSRSVHREVGWQVESCKQRLETEITGMRRNTGVRKQEIREKSRYACSYTLIYRKCIQKGDWAKTQEFAVKLAQ
ncbi:hypothetical protein AABB24_028421 [Solanum stoloniferum]|uniref:Uncharacterized protein n=1 Tax=Solanum stoloniferum TaxID=62892 RepID=A0ABD2S851_9SOLN